MRLLLAEDEKSLSRAIVVILEKNNYSVDAVYNGIEALEYLETGNYDGVIMDIMMPKMDGITALKKLREKGDSTPVLKMCIRDRLEAWAPFGEGRGGTFDHPVIVKLAEKYHKTPAQIMLRWHVQRGIVVIPKRCV